ncbi:MAG: Na+/H+ antiporter NhaA [Gammaproteobacteria bacterium]|jgi:Na+:H+ antiporter, NhaA family|nr:Na+/H+ antiporter NhaA [Gammaproteobacteria bacterium]MBT5154683.1 Na+/H+ antiporter NhaA [Gammaproteobacteria bacterium]MBT5685941.1 Na+/H+ antiporter NhaA [Gammaproteobacteria bacterium]MBT5725954.1 Na+/H+ antiporter NhaA [Gammaproteobacteria bacterium]MBT6582766.1 Na+/H+ antiporter NhaA [Gammaproteobacteria bacterium]
MTVEPVFIDRVTRPFQMFLEHKLAGAGLLLVFTIVALLWANSGYSDSYHGLLHTYATIGIGEFELSKTLSHWINDGLMGIFFFVVGLEIKREFLAGELANPKTAALPIFGALGGVLAPALIYLAINPSGEASLGWGIPMATDIAFALGILALFPVSISLKVFLTALAIVDDIGAILVVAIFYTDDIALQSLAIGGCFLLVSITANMAGVRNPVLYFLIGFVVWVAFLKSGVHATLSAVLMAFTIPARTRIHGNQFAEQAEALLKRLRETGLPQGNALLSSEQHSIVHSMEQVTEQATAPLQELEHTIMPYVTFMIMPIFALANAGVVIAEDFGAVLTSSIAVGIVAGLVIGKPLGIFVFAWLSVKLKVAELPEDVTFTQIGAVGMLAGVGFTMALFISTLAWADTSIIETAKTGVLLGSLVSALIGSFLLYLTTRNSS